MSRWNIGPSGHVCTGFALSMEADRFWHGLDIMACIVHKVVKELDVAEC